MSFVWGIGKASGHCVVPYLTDRAALWCWHPGPWPEGKTRCAANEREQQNPGDKHWEAWHFLNKLVINVYVVDNAVSVLALKPFKCVCVHCSINLFWDQSKAGSRWELFKVARQHLSDPTALRDEPYTWGFMSFCVVLVLLGLEKCIVRPHYVHTGDGKLNVQATDRWRPGYLHQPNIHSQSPGATWVKVPGPRTQRHGVSLEAAGFFFFCRAVTLQMRLGITTSLSSSAGNTRPADGGGRMGRVPPCLWGGIKCCFLFKCVWFGHSFAVGKYNRYVFTARFFFFLL